MKCQQFSHTQIIASPQAIKSKSKSKQHNRIKVTTHQNSIVVNHLFKLLSSPHKSSSFIKTIAPSTRINQTVVLFLFSHQESCQNLRITPHSNVYPSLFYLDKSNMCSWEGFYLLIQSSSIVNNFLNHALLEENLSQRDRKLGYTNEKSRSRWETIKEKRT